MSALVPVFNGVCALHSPAGLVCFFFNDPATTEIYTLSLHDALPICRPAFHPHQRRRRHLRPRARGVGHRAHGGRSEEHTSELQSLTNLVCRLLLEKKNTNKRRETTRPTINTDTSV